MDSTLTLLLQLFLAHIIGDFVLQTDRMHLGKMGRNKNGTSNIPQINRFLFLITHSAIHGILTFIILNSSKALTISFIIFFSHMVLDTVKSYTTRKESVKLFLIDQLFHSFIILLIVRFYSESHSPFFTYWLTDYGYYKFLIISIAYIFITKPTSIFLSLCLKKLIPNRNIPNSINNAGQWIGYLERVLIITFILINNFTAIGVLITLKSVFRFGELHKENELKATEYVLIGTMASFTIAIIVGLIAQYLILL